MDEFASIHHWTAHRQSANWQKSRGVAFGIGDDAAVMDLSLAEDGVVGEKRLLIAVDTMVETVHFSEQTMREEDVGYKALAANVSDIAAMGGVPLSACVAVSIPTTYSPARMRRVYDGLYACAEHYGVAIVGGDTTSSPGPMIITITITGTVESGAELRRSGAQPGDVVFLTGPIGMSAAGLHLLQSAGKRSGGSANEVEALYGSLIAAHQRPKPSVQAGRLLLRGGACHSLNDVSDGLASEAWELAEASGLRVVLRERLLPRSGSLTAYASSVGIDPLDWMLYGGEDYVLIGTAASAFVEDVKRDFQERGLPFYIIGKTEEGDPGVELERLKESWGSGAEQRLSSSYATFRVKVEKKGYNHF